jgi:hypothetical protein
MTSEFYSAAAISKAKTSVLSRLRSETQLEHDAIEEVLDLVSDSLAPDAYRRILASFYGYYRPLEQAVFAVREGEAEWCILEGRRKTFLLEQDLKSLGIASPDSLPLCDQIPQIGTAESVYGCLYVMEGATLGGQHIVVMFSTSSISAMTLADVSFIATVSVLATCGRLFEPNWILSLRRRNRKIRSLLLHLRLSAHFASGS